MNWIRLQGFELPSQQVCLEEYLQAVEEATARMQRLEEQIREHLEFWSQAPVVKAPMAHRASPWWWRPPMWPNWATCPVSTGPAP